MSDPKLHRQPRMGTIVWGAILVAVALLAIRIGAVGAPFTGAAVLWSVIAFGGILIVVAIVVAVVRAARRVPRA